MKNKIIFRSSAFTLIELLVTIVILGTLISFSIPKYNRSIELAQEKQSSWNLNLLRTSMKLYKMDHGDYPGNMNDINVINSTLTLAIIPDKMTYSCTLDSGEYLCVAASPYGWSLHVGTVSTEIPWNAHCAEWNPPDCPSCHWMCPWENE